MSKTELAELRHRLLEIVVAVPFFLGFVSLLHWVEGTRPLVTEFEAGGITGFAIIKLCEAIRTASTASRSN